MSKEHLLFGKIRPPTVGEKMLLAGFGTDIGVLATMQTLYYLQNKGVTHIGPEQIQSVTNILFWGGHIVVSDAILKLGGIIHMTFFEDKNWLFKKRNRIQS